MKTKTHHNKTRAQMLGLCLSALSALTSLAQTSTDWLTVLDYQFPTGTAGGNSIAGDGFGNVFSAGNGSDASGITRGIVLKTDTTQANWFLSDDSNWSPTQYESFIWDFGHDANGNLYSIGQLTANSTGLRYWYVRKSSDAGVNWPTVDLYQYAPGQWVNAEGFAADHLGNIYVVGWGRDASKKSYLHWLVRKSTDGGQEWSLVDDVQGPTSFFGAKAAGFVPGAGVFVVGGPTVGLSASASSSASWMVRRSSAGEPGTWTTVYNSSGGSAQAVGSDSQGNVYVVGSKFITTRTRPLTGYDAWMTCKSSNGGNTWSTVDTFAYATNNSAYALGVGRNSDGNVVVVGRGADAQGRLHWLARTLDSSGNWQLVDDFQLAPGYHASASGVAADAAGNLLVTGFGYDDTGSHWIVRRLAAPIP